jgi:ketosteroid isomerase-like protein
MSATDDIVSGIMAKWAENFGKFDTVGQASLYSKNALFYGSKPTLYRGRDGVASYFNGLAKWSCREVTFADVVAVPAGDDVINVAGIANFVIDKGATSLSVKLTWVIVREDGDWKIVSHHVSSRGALI